MAALAVRAFSNTNLHSIVCMMLCWLSGFSRTAVSALMYPDPLPPVECCTDFAFWKIGLNVHMNVLKDLLASDGRPEHSHECSKGPSGF